MLSDEEDETLQVLGALHPVPFATARDQMVGWVLEDPAEVTLRTHALYAALVGNTWVRSAIFKGTQAKVNTYEFTKEFLPNVVVVDRAVARVTLEQMGLLPREGIPNYCCHKVARPLYEHFAQRGWWPTAGPVVTHTAEATYNTYTKRRTLRWESWVREHRRRVCPQTVRLSLYLKQRP